MNNFNPISNLYNYFILYLSNNYFPCAYELPITIIKPQSAPTANEPEVMDRRHTVPAKPFRVLVIISEPGGKGGVTDEGGIMSVGFGLTFGISFATVDKAGPNNVKQKRPTTVENPIKKCFRFDFGFSLYSLNFLLKLMLKSETLYNFSHKLY
jgi:hypothetical protein